MEKNIIQQSMGTLLRSGLHFVRIFGDARFVKSEIKRLRKKIKGCSVLFTFPDRTSKSKQKLIMGGFVKGISSEDKIITTPIIEEKCKSTEVSVSLVY